MAFTASDGSRLATEESTGLDELRVAYSGSQDERVSLGRLGFDDLVQVTSANLTSGQVGLADVDVLWIGANLAFNASQAAGRDAVAAYLASGRGVAGKGTAIASFANAFGLVSSTATQGTSGSNGIVSVTDVDGGLLSTSSQDTAFVYPAVWYSGLGANAVVEQTYAAGDPFISGIGRRRSPAAPSRMLRARPLWSRRSRPRGRRCSCSARH